MNPIVLVLVILLVLENAETGWDVEDETENDEDETSVHGEELNPTVRPLNLTRNPTLPTR